MVQHIKTKTTVNEIKIKINEKICDVCEEIGAAKYFEGITCVACMKFFQKTVKNHEKYNCKEFKKCFVIRRTRNQCQYCRFEKCLTVRMNPKLIQNKNIMSKKISNKSFKKTVRTISCIDNYTIVRAIVIGIAYWQKLKIRSDLIRNYNNKKLQTEVLKALTNCKLLNTKEEINNVPILELYYKKYKIIIIDKNFISNNHIIYINNKDKFPA